MDMQKVFAETLAGAVNCRGQYVDGGIPAYIGKQP